MKATLMGAVVALTAIATVSPLEAQFGPHRQATDGQGGYTAPEMVRVDNDVIGIATTSGGTIYYTYVLPSLAAATPQLPDPDPQGPVALAASSGFLQFLAYAEEDGSGGAGERDIRVADNSAGPFGSPEPITANDTDDRDPSVLVSSSGERHLAWTSDEVGGTPLVRWKRGTSPSESLGNGSGPQIVPIDAGDVLVAYERGGNVYARRIADAGPEPEFPLLVVPGGIGDWSIHGTLDGDLHLAAVIGGALLVHSGSAAGGLGAGTPVTGGGLLFDGPPRIGSDALDRVVVVYAAGGQVYWSRSVAGTFPAGASIGASAGSTAPALAIDSLGHLHITYVRAGEVWYTNDVPVPTAGFVVQGGSGTLPLLVTFQDASSGVITSRSWDFGDGQTSSQIAPVHVYTEPGSYTVTLTVEGPGGEDTHSVVGAVSALLPPNVMEIADIVAFAGQPVVQPILLTHPDPLQGFQVAITYDTAYTPITAVNFAGTQVAGLGGGSCTPGSSGPEFLVVNNFPAGADSELIIAVIFDWSCPPFDGVTLDPGVEQTVGNLVYTVPINAPFGGTGPIRFTNGIGNPQIDNTFVVDGGTSVPPYTLDGSCTISQQPTFFFIRGDANYNLGVDIADAVFTLAYLFSNGADPECPDSADSNDDGTINIGDAIFTLGFLFSSGPTIPYPFPAGGLDPTADSLGICNPSPGP